MQDEVNNREENTRENTHLAFCVASRTRKRDTRLSACQFAWAWNANIRENFCRKSPRNNGFARGIRWWIIQIWLLGGILIDSSARFQTITTGHTDGSLNSTHSIQRTIQGAKCKWYNAEISGLGQNQLHHLIWRPKPNVDLSSSKSVKTNANVSAKARLDQHCGFRFQTPEIHVPTQGSANWIIGSRMFVRSYRWSVHPPECSFLTVKHHFVRLLPLLG